MNRIKIYSNVSQEQQMKVLKAENNVLVFTSENLSNAVNDENLQTAEKICIISHVTHIILNDIIFLRNSFDKTIEVYTTDSDRQIQYVLNSCFSKHHFIISELEINEDKPIDKHENEDKSIDKHENENITKPNIEETIKIRKLEALHEFLEHLFDLHKSIPEIEIDLIKASISKTEAIYAQAVLDKNKEQVPTNQN